MNEEQEKSLSILKLFPIKTRIAPFCFELEKICSLPKIINFTCYIKIKIDHFLVRKESLREKREENKKDTIFVAITIRVVNDFDVIT